MGLAWIRESTPAWDDDKQRVVGGAPPGVFEALRATPPGGMVPGEWWRAEDDGRVVAYGWMDVSWGDAEILLAVDPGWRRAGLGTYVLDRLDEEAARRGLRYLTNVVPEGHPQAGAVGDWLRRRGFHTQGEDWVLRRQVRA
jgi:ribosomal protein S18 acetylase RimI-like enzyme